MRCKNIYVLIFFLYLITAMHTAVFAQSPLNKTISLSVQHTDIKDILKSIETLANVKFAYSSENFNNTPVSVSFRNETLNNVLKQLFTDQHITFEAVGDLIVLHKNYSNNF